VEAVVVVVVAVVIEWVADGLAAAVDLYDRDGCLPAIGGDLFVEGDVDAAG
jgi:hypothetical protein